MTAGVALLVMVVAFSAGICAQTAARDPTDAETRRVNDRIRTLQSEADGLAGQARTLLGDLRQLEINRQMHVEHVRVAQAAIAESQAAIDASGQRLAALDAQRLTQLPDLRAQLVDVYKRGRTGYAAMLFGSSSAREFGRATRAVAALTRINEQRLVVHRRTVGAVREERARLALELRARQAREEEAVRARTAADRAFAARTALVARIDARRDLNAQLAGELQVAYARLKQQGAVRGSEGAAEPVTIPLAPFRGTLDWPVAGRITGRFGQGAARPGGAAVRNGIEIAAAEGAAVRAIHPGTVSFADPFTGFGNLAIVDHGANAYSLYGYLGGTSVACGDPVAGGTEIGRVGSAPAGPAALYLEIRIDGRSVDPIQWLQT